MESMDEVAAEDPNHVVEEERFERLQSVGTFQPEASRSVVLTDFL